MRTLAGISLGQYSQPRMRTRSAEGIDRRKSRRVRGFLLMVIASIGGKTYAINQESEAKGPEMRGKDKV